MVGSTPPPTPTRLTLSSYFQEILSLQLGIGDQDDHLFNGSALENGHPLEQPPKEPRQQARPTLGEDLAIL